MKAIPLYDAKEPLMPAADGGEGYQGVLLLDPKTDLVQCHVCGEWYTQLGPHINAKHKINARDYKIKFGLRQGTALVNEKLRVLRSKNKTKYCKANKEKVTALCRVAHKKRTPESFRRVTKVVIETQNTRGLCPMQILEKLKTAVKDNNGRRPSATVLEGYGIWQSTLPYAFGSVQRAYEMIGVKYEALNRVWERDPGLILAAIFDFRKRFKRWPSGSDFRRSNRLPCVNTVNQHFGSFTRVWKILGRKEV